MTNATMRVVEIWLGTHRFGIQIAGIDEVLPLVECRSLPGAPQWIIGMAQLRGAFVPLIDCGAVLNHTPVERTMNARIVLLQAGAVGGSMRLALLVDGVGAIVTVNPTTDGAHPGIAGTGRGALGAITNDDKGEICLIDLARLLNDQDRQLFRDAGTSP
ncbi:MAG: chemotaxis protein CheW [Phycisphaerales bacterium]|nr:chemotaxis protein CheW [Phycisphaerales bacterium]